MSAQESLIEDSQFYRIGTGKSYEKLDRGYEQIAL